MFFLIGMLCCLVEFLTKALLAACFLLAVFLAYFSALKMEALCFFKNVGEIVLDYTESCMFHSPLMQYIRFGVHVLSWL
jgi:hypothetical protein